MKELTFEGFLKRYVRNLSRQNTNDIFKLVHEAATDNSRLYEPLYLYACFSEKVDIFNRAIKASPSFDRSRLPDCAVNSVSDLSRLPYEYRKVYDSYEYYKNRMKNDNHTKSLMLEKIKRLQTNKNVTNYRIYTDLKLNPGNFNSFMKHENVGKCSLDTVRKVVSYLERYP